MNQVKTGHPKGLYVLFLAEMWERFCYYGMRALLVVYMTKSLMMGDMEAFAVYGAYTALVYAAPILGGRIADAILGYRIAVLFGGVVMAVGEFLILGGVVGDQFLGLNASEWLYLGLATIIVGNGYFKANISTIVGKLYKEGDARRDSGFTIFYIGINIGALLATTVCAEVGNIYGYEYGFALAGFGMLLGLIVFGAGQKHFKDQAGAPNPEKLHRRLFGPISQMHVVFAASLAVIPILYFLITQSQITFWLLIIAGAYVVISLLLAASKHGKVQLDRMIIMIILFFFNIVFWACFEQAGSSLTLFADRHIDRNIFGLFEMGAPTTQFFNPAFIIIFGSVFSVMWLRLSKIGKNPSIPMKFGLGLLQLGLGYLVVQAASVIFPGDAMLPLITIVILYLLHTTGELFLSPIGLSMVTKLAPKNMTGTAMGGWFWTFAMANFLAAEIAKLTGSVESATGEAVSSSDSFLSYVDVYTNMGLVTVGIGVLLCLLARPLNKLMHGVE